MSKDEAINISRNNCLTEESGTLLTIKIYYHIRSYKVG